jgi:hypothetical protein
LLLDGKGSRYREKYVDDNIGSSTHVKGVQLKWYAFLYRERYRIVPDGLVYIFWKFDYKEALEWVSFSCSDLDNLRDEVLSVLSRIDVSENKLKKSEGLPQTYYELRQEFFPAQSGKNCRFCSFLSKCDEGRSKKKFSKSLMFDGVNELTLGDE